MATNGGNKAEVRRQAAAVRALESAGRTPEQQLARLDAAGCVAKKERTKLALRIKIRDGKNTSTAKVTGQGNSQTASKG